MERVPRTRRLHTPRHELTHLPREGGRQTMKAIQYNRFGGPEVLEYVDVPVPSPGAGEVLIETTAVGVNFPDIRERLGIYNQKETRVGGVTLPQIGGVQVVGKVVDTGSIFQNQRSRTEKYCCG